MSSDKNPKKDSASSNSNASKKGATGPRKRKKRRSGAKGGGKRQGKSFPSDEDTVLRANERFDREGLPGCVIEEFTDEESDLFAAGVLGSSPRRNVAQEFHVAFSWAARPG